MDTDLVQKRNEFFLSLSLLTNGPPYTLCHCGYLGGSIERGCKQSDLKIFTKCVKVRVKKERGANIISSYSELDISKNYFCKTINEV